MTFAPKKTLRFAAMAAFAPLAAAQTALPAFDDFDDATVEAAFWNCDARATRTVLAPADGVLCERLAEALQQRRFGGDFAQWLAWWREHKAVEHARRAPSAPGDAVGLAAPETP